MHSINFYAFLLRNRFYWAQWDSLLLGKSAQDSNQSHLSEWDWSVDWSASILLWLFFFYNFLFYTTAAVSPFHESTCDFSSCVKDAFTHRVCTAVQVEFISAYHGDMNLMIRVTTTGALFIHGMLFVSAKIHHIDVEMVVFELHLLIQFTASLRKDNLRSEAQEFKRTRRDLLYQTKDPYTQDHGGQPKVIAFSHYCVSAAGIQRLAISESRI